MTNETTSREHERRRARTSGEARDYLASTNGWSVVSTGRGGGGMRAHRGVLHPDEYVDVPRLRALVEHHLGFTLDDLGTVYRQGPKSAAQLELRSRIDVRFLKLREAGGNLELLARVTTVDRKVIGRAMARARAADAACLVRSSRQPDTQ